VRAIWKARLSEHLGLLQVEMEAATGAALLDDRLALAGLNSACALTIAALPEREPHSAIYEGFTLLLDHLADPGVWPAMMVRFEAGLLADLGYGLDLSRCAATGALDDLVWISPNTGRAVSAGAGEPYREKLLALPPFLLGTQAALQPGDVGAGFRLTGWFLERRILWPADRQLPRPRETMLDALAGAGRL
jgi:DNA repair protein RecO (recombination protein O)